jgi:hypothetical protein
LITAAVKLIASFSSVLYEIRHFICTSSGVIVVAVVKWQWKLFS